jgi:hypothetical protein
MPSVLAGRRIGRWRWAGPGVRVAWLNDEAGEGEQLYLLKARAGSKLPDHGHEGAERVVVLEGAFVDGTERFGPATCPNATPLTSTGLWPPPTPSASAWWLRRAACACRAWRGGCSPFRHVTARKFAREVIRRRAARVGR